MVRTIDLTISNFNGLKKKGAITKLKEGVLYVVWFFLTTEVIIAGTGIGMTGLQLIWAVVSIGFSIYSACVNSGGKDGLRDPNSMDANGQLVNSRQSIDPIRVVYGQAQVGGVWVFSRASRSSNKMLNTVITWSEGEIEGVATAIDPSPIFNGGAAYTTLNDLKTSGEFTSICTCYLSAHGFVGCTTCDVACHVYTP